MQNFVGVFDSGVGGLTVLAELKKAAQNCNFVYLADRAFCPYGTRPLEEIKSRVFAVAQYLKDIGAQSLVVACNTASVFAPALRRKLKLPVFDVIYPTCCAVFEHPSFKKVVILATDATVKSGVYQRVLNSFGVETTALACSEFVPLAENGASSKEKSQIIGRRLRCLREMKFDALVLGCTHFPLLTDQIAAYAEGRRIISCSTNVAKYFAKSRPHEGQGKVRQITTGDAFAANFVDSFCGAEFCHIDL